MEPAADRPPRRPLPPSLAAGAVFLALAAGAAAPHLPRPAAVLVLLALVAAAGASGWRAAGALLPDAGLASRLVCAATVAAASIVCTATLLGHFGWLRPRPFLALQALLFALGRGLPPRPLPAGAPLASVRWSSRAGLERALLLAAAALLAARLGGSLVHVAKDPAAFLGYDDLSYHLPAVAVWHRFGDLRMLRPEAGDPSPAFYPFASELCSWALLAPLGDSDVLARRIQLPFAVLSLVAVAALARRLGLGRRSALFAALLYAAFDRAFPVLALGAGNDHATAFFLLASLDGGLALAAQPAWGAAAYAGIALGLLAGTKYIGLVYAATLFALIALLAAAAGRAAARRGEASLPALLAALAGLAVLCGGYAYARNAWTTGNPLFPAPLDLFGHRLLPGWTAASLAWRRHLPEFQIDSVRFLTRRPDLFGPLFPWTLLPAAVAAPALALLSRRARLAAVLALPIVLFLEFRFLMHDHRDVRYLLAAVALAAVAAAWLLAAVPPALGAPLRLAALLGVLWTVAGHLHADGWRRPLVVALAAGAGAALAAAGPRATPLWRDGGRWGRAARLGAAALGCLAVSILGARAVESFQAAKLRGESAALALDRETAAMAAKAPARVAYVGSNQPYLYFGSRLQNDVEIVPTNAALGAEYYRWGADVSSPFAAGSLPLWRSNLGRRRIDLVVAARGPQEGPERAWMAGDAEHFLLLHEDPLAEIWWVLP